MNVVGVDLASQNARTALVGLHSDGDHVRVSLVHNGCDDDQIIEAAREADMVGLDSPLGWPEPFVEFVTSQQAGLLDPADLMDREAKARLAFRQTDAAVLAAGAGRPLSVSTGFLSYVAMRAAALQARLSVAGMVVDRSGRTGSLIEVYPAASLRSWGLREHGYRQGGAALATALDRLLSAAPFVDLGGHRDTFESSVDCFDALVAALTALAHAFGRTVAAPDDEVYRREGWIVLPASDFLKTYGRT